MFCPQIGIYLLEVRFIIIKMISKRFYIVTIIPIFLLVQITAFMRN